MTNATQISQQRFQIQTGPRDGGIAAASTTVEALVVDALGKGAGISVLLMSAEKTLSSISCPYSHLGGAKTAVFRSLVAAEASIGCDLLMTDAAVAMQWQPCSSYVQNLKFLLIVQ